MLHYDCRKVCSEKGLMIRFEDKILFKVIDIFPNILTILLGKGCSMGDE
ncbi:MAG: hypothetical protein RMI79_00700 [Nitrososphaerota archaeon]|nr:hypothetical protein [Nitrososphaerota archaeon]